MSNKPVKPHFPSPSVKGLTGFVLLILLQQNNLTLLIFLTTILTTFLLFQHDIFRSKTTSFRFPKFPETLEITTFLRFLNNGAEGSRTPVRKPIHCTSTSLANCLTFPPSGLNQHNPDFSRLQYAHSHEPLTMSFPTYSMP